MSTTPKAVRVEEREVEVVATCPVCAHPIPGTVSLAVYVDEVGLAHNPDTGRLEVAVKPRTEFRHLVVRHDCRNTAKAGDPICGTPTPQGACIKAPDHDGDHL